MFSLARALPSPISAEVCPSLFDRFTGTMARSDSSATCRSAVRLFAFSGRSRSWLDREVPEVSRFSCMLFLSVRGFLDYAEPADRSRFLRSQPCCLPLLGKGSASLITSFRSSIARPTDTLVYASAETSQSPPQDSRPGWSRFLLSCRDPSSPTTCRFTPAHPRTILKSPPIVNTPRSAAADLCRPNNDIDQFADSD